MIGTKFDYATDFKNLQKAIDNHQLRIVIPTMNSQDYLETTLSYYRDIGLPVTVIVDSKSADETELIARTCAKEVVLIHNSSNVVEGMIQELSLKFETQWILRIDDDELPSIPMLNFVATMLDNEKIHAVGFPRKQCAVSKKGFIKSSKLHSASSHTQWRMYKPAFVNYRSDIHTPGFSPLSEQSIIAPQECFMIHLDWSLHTYQNRLAKINRYDQHASEMGSKWRSFYLFEEDDQHGLLCFEKITNPEFGPIANKIRNLFPNNCLDEPSVTQKIIWNLKKHLKI